MDAESILPPCVELAGKAAARLRDVALRSPAPFIEEPTSDADVAAIAKGAIAWGEAILEAYGEYGMDERYPDSVLALFVRHEPEVLTFKPRDKGPYGDALRGPAQFTPASASLDRAADVLGEIPAEFRVCLARTRAATLGSVAQGHLAGRRGTAPIPQTLERWPEIRAMLRARHQIGLAQALGLAAWVEQRISALEFALSPTITGDATDDVVVMQAGISRTVRLPHVLRCFLGDLSHRGEGELGRSRRTEFLDRLPELAPWLAPHATKKARGASDAIYTVPPAVQKRIRLPLRPALD